MRTSTCVSDYLALARRFHTVIMVGIPVLGPDNPRFVTLIDALYEYKVKFLVSANAASDASYA